MTEREEKVELIKQFLEGSDDQKYITGIEGNYWDNEVHLMIDHPEKGKYVEKQSFTPFLFVKDFNGKKLYNSDQELAEAKRTHGITITKLRTDKKQRLEAGHKYKVTTSKKLGNLNQFFSKAGYNIYQDPDRLFLCNSGIEQFFMTTGKRLFKGFTSYNSIHKFYFDIETTGLVADDSFIFLIGMKDNRGFEKVLKLDRDNPIESERQMIIDFFQTIVDMRPAIVAGYNSEEFDFRFILKRAEILGIDLGSKDIDGGFTYDVQTSLHRDYPLKRKPSTVKFGGETENYEQTIMWGVNVVDISHAVRKTMAINSDIKGWGLKYICQYSEIAKENRMYVADGSKIYKIWEENKWYFINRENNQYKLIPYQCQDKPEEYKQKLKNWVSKGKLDGADDKFIKVSEFFNGDVNNVDIIRGEEIIFQYLLDDLSETEMVDNRFNQSAFMLGAITPTSFVRASTMGNASLWKLLMLTYSYINNLAIPVNGRKKDIVGGLSRLLKTGYAKKVLKLDYKSLYPSIQLTHDVFPDFDITNVMEAMLTYFRDARIEYQELSKKYDKEGDKELANFYDTKQLPIKILANSMFGALSSPAIFPWGDNNIGERITCTGRQYLRLMVAHFHKNGYEPLVLDTDGCNFTIPDNSEDFKYINKLGEELSGYEAVLEDFNDKYMTGVMRLDLDGLYISTINFSRKNYANLIFDEKKNKEKIKLVGNSIKSKGMQSYIESFLNKGIKLLLAGNGKDFVTEYYDYIEKIYNMQIPLKEISNKAKVKQKVKDYQLKQLNERQVNGKPYAKQCHMELLIEHGLNPNLGSVIYYVNNGKRKSHGDIGNSYMLDERDFETNPEKLGEYNIARYVEAFNKKIKPLTVCFKEEIRNSLIISNPKDRNYFTDTELELISGAPLEIDGADALFIEDYKPDHKNVPLLEMEEREVIFWNRMRLDPNEIFTGFTTELSNVKLIDLSTDNFREMFPKIQNYFNLQGIEVKTENDFLLEGDLVAVKEGETWYLKNYQFGELNGEDVIEESILAIV